MTALAAAVRQAAARLAAAGVASPRFDAEELAAHVLGIRRTELVVHEELDERRYAELVDFRASRVPLQHLTGTAGFRRLELAVGPGVFVPRPETESLVEWVLGAAPQGARVVDLCSGSGAIPLSLADERPDLTVYAVEREADAFAWLQRNAEGSGVHLVRGDAADALAELDGTVDVVVSNPPYVPLTGRPLEPEVAEHDPPTAIYAGDDGLDLVRVVSRTGLRLARPGGLFAVEHSDAQGEVVPAVLRGHGWRDVEDHLDLTGRDRFATGRRAG